MNLYYHVRTIDSVLSSTAVSQLLMDGSFRFTNLSYADDEDEDADEEKNKGDKSREYKAMSFWSVPLSNE